MREAQRKYLGFFAQKLQICQVSLSIWVFFDFSKVRGQRLPENRQSPTKIFRASDWSKVADLAQNRQIWQH